MQCPQWGDLIDYVVRILRHHKLSYLIIENVPNLVRHNQGKIWAGIERKLRAAGYDVDDHKLSPHQFGIPQTRERAFIVGQRGTLDRLCWPTPPSTDEISISTILERSPSDARLLTEPSIKYLETWQVFLDALPKEEASILPDLGNGVRCNIPLHRANTVCHWIQGTRPLTG